MLGSGAIIPGFVREICALEVTISRIRDLTIEQ